jgi:hypothetical protein
MQHAGCADRKSDRSARRAGSQAYLLVPESQLEAVRGVLRAAHVGFEVSPYEAAGSGAVLVTLIGGDADLRRAQDALDRAH